MRHFTLTGIISTILLSYLFFAGPAAAQNQYGNQVVSYSRTTNWAQAADRDITTASTLTPDVVGTSASQRIQFATIIPAGSTSAGLYMQVNNLSSTLPLMASVLNNVTINTYLDGTKTGSWPASKLLSLSLLSYGQQQRVTLDPAPSSPFNQLELVGAGATNAYSLNLFEAFGPSPAPLPVQLVSFRGQPTAAGVKLAWQTASELTNSYFAVERAATDAAGFVELGRMAGAGTSAQSHSYQYVDPTPLALAYYRLRQVDAAGNISYSPVVAVQSNLVLSAYPSPAASTLTVTSPVATQVAIWDQHGRLVHQTLLASGSQVMDVSQLPAGLYVLHAPSTGQRLRFEKLP